MRKKYPTETESNTAHAISIRLSGILKDDVNKAHQIAKPKNEPKHTAIHKAPR